MRIEQIRRSLTVHRLMPGVFLCFLCSVLLAANEECLTSEGLWAATSKTSTLYLPVIYLNPTKQITAEGIYQCFISLAAASTERRTLTITIIVATVVVSPFIMLFSPRTQSASRFRAG